MQLEDHKGSLLKMPYILKSDNGLYSCASGTLWGKIFWPSGNAEGVDMLYLSVNGDHPKPEIIDESNRPVRSTYQVALLADPIKLVCRAPDAGNKVMDSSGNKPIQRIQLIQLI